MRIYEFQGFHMEYHLHTGAVKTVYPDDAYSHVDVNKDHYFHANLLELSGSAANLQHELAHHLVAIAYNNWTCPIIFNSAIGGPMPDKADVMEWKITALSYFALKKPMRHSHEWAAIREMAERFDVWKVADDLWKLLYGRSTNKVNVRIA